MSCLFRSFKHIRNSICLPFSPKNACYYLSSDCNVEKINKDYLKKATLTSLKNITETMLNDRIEYDFNLGGFVGGKTVKGIYGLQMLKKDLKELIGNYNSDDINQQKILQLTLLFIRNNMMFGSHTAFRSELFAFLHICADKYGITEFHQISNDYSSIADNWKRLFLDLSSISHNQIDLVSKTSKVLDPLDSIIIGENQLFIAIREILCKNGIE